MYVSAPLLTSLPVSSPLPKPRRSGNYVAPTWDADFIDSVSIDPLDESQMRRIDELRTKVVYRFNASVSKPAMLLDLIDSIQQLGIRYRFEDEVVEALKYVSDNRVQVLLEKDLHSTSLMFRLFRDNGLEISQDVFESFRDEENGWEACFRRNNLRAILSLYEASYLAFENEALLDEIKIQTTSFLQELQASSLDANLKEKVGYALKIPLHWRFPRFHTLWFMNKYARDEGKNSEALELARLDFNRVQLEYRREVKEISRWWIETGLREQILFSRDRVVEQFIWALATASFDPNCGNGRLWTVKASCILTLIDDTYDVYGTLDELEMFTDIIERWAVEDIHILPKYMQILFMALFNHVNDLIYHNLKDRKVIVTLQARRLWAQICKAYFQEAKWYHNHIIPTFEEYMNTATITAGTVLLLSYAYIINSKDIDMNILDWIHENKGLTRLVNSIGRFTNDLGTTKYEREKGDAPNAMDCYIHQNSVSEAEATNYVHCEIEQTWKKINKDKFGNLLLPKSLIDGFLNFGRVCHCIYQNEDDFFTCPTKETHAALKSLFFEPVRLDG